MSNDTLMPGAGRAVRSPLQRLGVPPNAGTMWSTFARRLSFARRGGSRSRRLNLALQGGGAHGAFTWGVLDALLARGDLGFDGVSGTSAGAVNAVALAAGLMDGGADGARESLHDIWSAISRAGAPTSHPGSPLAYSATAKLSGALMQRSLERIGGGWSPYDVNPLNLNPLRDILLARIDFEKLRRESPVHLFIAATEVASGRGRVFRTHEISADSVVASACLPNLFPAVRIGRFYYWDGAFSANPDLLTLISETRSDDTLLVQISPDRDPDLPSNREEISGNIGRLTFNHPLRTQVQQIEICRRVPRIPLLTDNAVSRMGRHRFHLIDGSPHTLKLARGTKHRPDWHMIESLRDVGRQTTIEWCEAHLSRVGKRPTADLYGKYFSDRVPFD